MSSPGQLPMYEYRHPCARHCRNTCDQKIDHQLTNQTSDDLLKWSKRPILPDASWSLHSLLHAKCRRQSSIRSIIFFVLMYAYFFYARGSFKPNDWKRSMVLFASPSVPSSGSYRQAMHAMLAMLSMLLHDQSPHGMQNARR